MNAFLNELTPRRLLKLDDPSQHLTVRQYAVALIVTGLSAALWGFVTRSMFVVLMIFGTQILHIWRSPAANERPGPRLAAALFWGAFCAGAWLLMKLL
ncbi:MAG: hypothetical protein HYR73_02785 [Candidatus Eisenbacteria bacterium]|nr:hypothetical protein [Candidatus Eisenbacteria bacterium]